MRSNHSRWLPIDPRPQIVRRIARDEVDHLPRPEIHQPGRELRRLIRLRLQERGLIDPQLVHLAHPVLVLQQRLTELDHRLHRYLPADPELIRYLLHRVHLADQSGDLHRRPLGQASSPTPSGPTPPTRSWLSSLGSGTASDDASRSSAPASRTPAGRDSGPDTDPAPSPWRHTGGSEGVSARWSRWSGSARRSVDSSSTMRKPRSPSTRSPVLMSRSLLAMPASSTAGGRGGGAVQVEMGTAEWVDWWNHRRLHSAADNLPPAEYEQLWRERVRAVA